MDVLRSVAAVRCFVERFRQGEGERSVGLVPTMGALHDGHRSLIKRSRDQDGLVVVSIFVNPLQFGPDEDFARYPRSQAADLALCEELGVDAVFLPTAEALGIGTGDGGTQVVPPPSMTAALCGRSRPGHFTGVATIVMKLFNIVQPDHGYFGQKDAQQVAILKRMVTDTNLPVELVVCPIVREADGLALSSRNRYLSAAERQRSLVLSQALAAAKTLFAKGDRQGNTLLAAAQSVLTAAGSDLVLDYLTLVHPDTLTPLETVESVGLLAVAAQVGPARLIDNVLLRDRQPIIAIDGPAGAGKSTVTRRVARELGLIFLDTGAMYRSVTWLALHEGKDPGDRVALADLVSQAQIRLSAPKPDATDGGQTGEAKVEITYQGQTHDVTRAIRTAEVTANVSAVAAHREVRRSLVAQQQAMGEQGGLVAEGRDIGTHVFPDAEVKIFLTATPAERARRRQADLTARNQPCPDLATLEAEIQERDRLDSSRAIAPLRQAADAWELVTDGMTIDAVVNAIKARYPQ
ncbi:MAG: bifunctional pantoate--beta-alanine ligase/(d)CMP kinase [Cyanobacteria bacterium P01_H01_bin.130]